MRLRVLPFFLMVIMLAVALLCLAGCGTKKTNDAMDVAAVTDAAPAAQAGAASQNDPDAELDDSEFDNEPLDDSEFDDDPLDDSEFDTVNATSTELIPDPIEPWNRIWFTFNDFFYIRIAKPVYEGYEAVVPEDLRAGFSNAWRNLQAPVRIVNSILQFEFAQAVVEFGRFMVNSTVGGLGLAEIIPPEKSLVPLSLETANFSGTLAKWGFGDGFYLVWPVLGPSTLRDSIGLAGDTASSPIFWVTEPIGPVNTWATTVPTAGLTFNDMGSALKSYETLKKVAIEPYSAMRDAYIKQRQSVFSAPSNAPFDPLENSVSEPREANAGPDTRDDDVEAESQPQ